VEYMILIYGDESAFGSIKEAQLKAMYAEYGTYTQELMKAGVMRAGSELKPASTATTVRLRGGKVLTTDGPFAETKEQLAGFYLIEARDLNEALQVAGGIPAARVGSVEVRPVRQLNL